MSNTPNATSQSAGGINQQMSAIEWGLLLLLSMIWGGSFFFGMVILRELPPLTLVLGRVTLGALIMHLFLRIRGESLPREPKAWLAFLVMGALNNVIPFSLIFWGETQISSSLASILNATTPLWGAVVAHFLTHDERLTSNRLFGVLIGLVGVVVMIGSGAMRGLGLNILAQIAVVTASLSYAFASVWGKRFKGMSLPVVVTGQLTCSTLLMLPIAGIIDKPWQLTMPGWQTWAALVGLALFCTAVAYLIYFRLLTGAGATNALVVTLLVPISATILGVLFLNETLALRHVLGMLLIALGLGVMDGRPLIWLWPGRARRSEEAA